MVDQQEGEGIHLVGTLLARNESRDGFSNSGLEIVNRENTGRFPSQFFFDP